MWAVRKHVRVLSYTLICGSALSCANDARRVDSPQELRAAVAAATQPAVQQADRDMAAVLVEHASMNPKAIENLSPADARKQPTVADAVLGVLQDEGKVSPPAEPAMRTVVDKKIKTPGFAIPVRIYTPQTDRPRNAIVYFHGGGWVIGSVDLYDSSCRALADATKSVVISVDYRQAPEHKFPAAYEDAYAALQHVMHNPQEYGFAADGAVAVAGESAGGNLATAVCIMSHQRGGKMPVHQLLVYPVTDFAFDKPSYREHADAKPLNAAMMTWFFNQFLHQPSDGDSPLVSPLRADERLLRALPPATFVLAEIDPLRSDGQLYALKLEGAGVDVESKTYPGATHEFFGMTAVVGKARQAQTFAADRLNAAFTRAQAAAN